MKNKNVRTIVSLALNLLLIIVGVYIVFSVGTKAYTFGIRIFNEQSIDTAGNEREVEVTIASDISPKKMAKLLYDKGLVNDETVAYFQIQLSDYKDKFIAGTYILNTAMKPTDMMMEMSDTDTADLEE